MHSLVHLIEQDEVVTIYKIRTQCNIATVVIRKTKCCYIGES